MYYCTLQCLSYLLIWKGLATQNSYSAIAYKLKINVRITHYSTMVTIWNQIYLQPS